MSSQKAISHFSLLPAVFEAIGRRVYHKVYNVGNASILAISTLLLVFKRPFGVSMIIKQLHAVGVNSFSVVLITGCFVGMVVASQAYHQLDDLSAQGMMGMAVAVTIIKELGPVVTSFILAGRVGAGMTAEIGSMRVTEQVDALSAMAVSPVKYLVVPRFLACTIMFPVLTTFSNCVGLIGGYITTVKLLGMNGPFFISQTTRALFVSDIFIGIFKAIVFGCIVAVVGCYRGLSVPTNSGAEGVGKATTSSAVTSLILILAVDFFLGHILYAVF